MLIVMIITPTSAIATDYSELTPVKSAIKLMEK